MFADMCADVSSTVGGANVLNVFSFSKAYGLMGWRVGYIAYHEEQVLPLSCPIHSCQALSTPYLIYPCQHLTPADLTTLSLRLSSETHYSKYKTPFRSAPVL